MKIKLELIILFLIFFLGLFLRVYKLDKIPPSLNWDEVAAGYNAYTIAHWGKDEWGKTLPLVFTSFRDDKHPVHIYLTAPFVGIFGLSDFTARFPAAFFSSLTILLVYLLAKKIFKSDLAGLLAALFLAISPYHLHFSRGLWEIDFAFFFFLLGLTAFFYGIEKPKLLSLAFFSFGMSLYAYHASKIVVLPLVLFLILLYFRQLLREKRHFFLSLSIFLIFILGFVLEPRLLGLARVKQTSFSESSIKSTWIYQYSGKLRLSTFEIALKNYPAHFSVDYLFKKGDQNPRNSVKIMGEFYKVDALLIVVGFLSLLFLRSKMTLVILAWLLLAPLPSALSSATPNAVRAMYMLGSVHLVSALGAIRIINFWQNRRLQILTAVLLVGILGFEFSKYLNYYFFEYPKQDAIEWQYGMKEVVEYVNANPDYYKIYMDKIRQQPYIFFLFYNQTPLPEFLKTVKYDETESKSYNTVLSYDRYQFGGWDFVESYPNSQILYVLEPSKYSGLRFINDFEVVRLVKYPNNLDAFYLISGYNE
jgi:4-amino-4-deoxy-L-arabinose transferase-like glycosyltransferase